MTTLSGPLTAAIGHPAARRARAAAATRASRAGTDGHRPPARQRLHQPPARGDQREPVLQAEHAGDAGGDVLAHAVPGHRRRPTPQDRHSSASAYSTANSAGWVYAVWSSRAAPAPSGPSSGQSTASRERSRRGASSAAQRSSARRKAG